MTTPSNMINLKVFLRDENVSEARRFTVDASVCTSFIFMKEKLQTVFPNLRETDFKITWKDYDGDEITIASDEDYITAFTEMVKDVKVLFVTVVSHKSEPIFLEADMQDIPFRGPRIVCDVCNKTITGYRYKCLQCVDYDLCIDCEHQGHHSEHLVIRVPNHELFMPKCGRKFMHHLARNLKKSAYHASKEACRAAKYATRFTPMGGRTEETKNDEQAGASAQTPGQGKEQEQPQCPFASGEGININDIHALGAMAREHLGPLLNALGGQQSNPSDPNANNQDQGLFIDLIRNAVDGFFGRVPETATGNEPQQQQQTEKTQQPQEKSQEQAKQPTTNADGNANQVPMDVETAREGSHVTFTPTTPQNTPQIPERRDPGWTFVANQAPTAATNGNISEAPATAPTFVYHENPKIAEGLVRLHEMGFSNETGYLTHLLERYGGNVSEVVKAIVDMKI